MSLQRYCYLACAAFMLLAYWSNSSAQLILFEENFDNLTPSLGGSVNERIGTAISSRVATDPESTPFGGVWSASSPGWTVDNNLSAYDGSPTRTPGVAGQGVADYGVDEWEGWSFADKDFWSEAAGDQDRSQFGTATAASGIVAVADPDEYYDLGDPDDAVHGGYYSSALRSTSFPVVAGGFYGLGFDSSWRYEAFDDDAPGLIGQNNQAVEIVASFDVGGDVQVVKWNSDDTPDAFFKPDATDENRPADGTDLFFEAPIGATSASLSFNIANAGNDWWWAIDNIEVNDLTGGSGQIYFDDFESTSLGDSVNERLAPGGKVTEESSGVTTILGTDYPTSARPESFTHTPPAGWNVDNTGTPNVGGDDGDGVFEWEQWSFATPEFWTFADGQGRQDFTKGSGVIAIADGDEWEDLADPGDDGDLTTFMETPVIDISATDSHQMLRLTFDSSWRAEDNQSVLITAMLDSNAVELLRWESDPASAFFHGDNVDESVSLLFDAAGASDLQLRFSYQGNDDWWWAVDNIRVDAVPEPSTALLAGCVLCCCIGVRRRSTFQKF